MSSADAGSEEKGEEAGLDRPQRAEVGGRTSTTRLLEKKTWGRRQSESQEGNLLTYCTMIHHASAVAATTCRNQWHRDARGRRNARLSATRLQTYCDAATSCGEGDTPAAT